MPPKTLNLLIKHVDLLFETPNTRVVAHHCHLVGCLEALALPDKAITLTKELAP